MSTIFIRNIQRKLVIASLPMLLALISQQVFAKGEYESLFVIERQILNTHVNADGSDVEVEELTKLISSQLAVDGASQADIDYNSTFQDVEVLEAYTILPSGNKVPVAANAIRTVEDDISSGAAQFSDQKHKIIIFPNVSIGARVYYKVKTTTHTPLFPKNYQNSYYFSPYRDVTYLEWNFSHDSKINIEVDAKGLEGGKIQKAANGDIQYRFIYKFDDIQIREPYQISYADFSPHLILSSFKSQIDLGRAYEERAKPKMALTPAVQSLADDLTKDIQLQEEQAKVLYQWVSKNIRYVAIYLGAGGVVPNDAESIIHNRYGDCKDHDILLRALLAAKGIETSSVLINLGASYNLHTLGTISPNNHAITYIPQWDLYLDSTQQLAPFGILSQQEMDKPVVLTALNKIGHTPKLTPQNNQMRASIQLKIDKDGRVIGSSKTIYKGSSEIDVRDQYTSYVSITAEKMVKDHLSAFAQTGEGKFMPSDPYDLNKPFTLESAFKLDPVVNMPGPGAMSPLVGLSPGIFASVSATRPRLNRKFQYMCKSQTLSESYVIEFPKGINITTLPKNQNVTVKNDSYSSKYTRKDNIVTVERVLKLNRPSLVCDPEEAVNWNKVHQVIQKDLLGQIIYK